MFSVASLNRVNYFYPVGNTPAVCLTQYLPARLPPNPSTQTNGAQAASSSESALASEADDARKTAQNDKQHGTEQNRQQRPATVLSLGCGDLRHLLFTTYSDRTFMSLLTSPTIHRNIRFLSHVSQLGLA